MTQAYPIRCRIRNDGGVTRVDVYDDIGEGGWFSEGLTAKSFAGQLSGVKGALEVHVNSGGGDVFDGIAIGNAIRAHKGPVTTVVDGLAASIASVIAQAGQQRVVQPGSMLMIHDAFGGCVGNAAEMAKMAETLDQVSDNLATIYADRAGGTPQQWRDAMRTEAWYTADEAVAAGLADRVGDGEAQLPAGLDVAAFTAVPARIAARLRSMPQAKAPVAADDSGSGDGGKPPCKTCGGSGRLRHPGTGKAGVKCPGCDGAGTYDPDAGGDDDDTDDDGQGDDEGMQDRLRDAAGKPYEPQPYKRTPDENVQCPACSKFGDDDSRYCGQCGTQLTGRTDVREAALAPAARAAVDAAGLRAYLRDELRAAGLLPGADGYMRPADSFYHAASGVDNSDWDGGKAMAAGADADDPAAFYKGICAGQKDGNPRSQSSWALPYRYAPDGPPNAAGVKNALGRLPQTQGLTNEAEARKTLEAAMKQVNPDWEPDDKAGNAASAAWLEQLRGGLPSLMGGRA